MNVSSIPKVLGDTNLMPLVCSHCSNWLDADAKVEVEPTSASDWVCVHCKYCDHWTPKQWEKA